MTEQFNEAKILVKNGDKIFAANKDGEFRHVPSLDRVAQSMSEAQQARGLVTLDGPVEFIHG